MIEKKVCGTFNRESQLKLKNNLLRWVEGSDDLDSCFMSVAECILFHENPPSAYPAQWVCFLENRIVLNSINIHITMVQKRKTKSLTEIK